MNNSVVYVITSEGRDIYSIMTWVSLMSVKITNPLLKTVIVCDKQTENNLIKSADPLLKEAHEVLTFDVSLESPVHRNRYLKTNLRNLIQGKLLFLDSDTIVRKKINHLFDIEEDLALSCNHSKEKYNEQIKGHDEEFLSKINWTVRKDVYFNGGVIFYNDTKAASVFSSMWHEKWKQSSLNMDNYRDQPALNHSIYESKINVKLLSPIYNLQIKTSPLPYKEAAIWHFYSSIDLTSYLYFEKYIQQILLSKRKHPNYTDMKIFIKRKHPYVVNHIGDFLVINRILKKGTVNPIYSLYLSGNITKAISSALKYSYRYGIKKIWNTLDRTKREKKCNIFNL